MQNSSSETQAESKSQAALTILSVDQREVSSQKQDDDLFEQFLRRLEKKS